jgi:hypothetical protein
MLKGESLCAGRSIIVLKLGGRLACPVSLTNAIYFSGIACLERDSAAGQR